MFCYMLQKHVAHQHYRRLGYLPQVQIIIDCSLPVTVCKDAAQLKDIMKTAIGDNRDVDYLGSSNHAAT